MKKLLLTIIIFIIMLSPKHISINNVDYFAYSRMDQSTKTNIASSLNSFKRSISNIPIYNTNKFNCTVSSSNVNCSSSSYQGVGLLSYPEYTKIGGNNSYLYSSNPYFVLNNGSVKTLTQSGLTDSEPSYVKASIYVKNGAAVKGNGSKNDPYKIVESFCYVTTDATSCIVLEGRNTLGDLPTPTRVGYTFTGWYSEETDGFKVTSSTLISELPEKRIYARWTPIKYNIMILTWYGQIENLGSDNIIATYDETYTINNPTKVVTFRGIANGTGATVGANTTNTQTFAGWNITGMDSVTHTYGSSTTTSTSISSTTATSFKNLRSTSGTVTFTAKWNSVTTNLPTVSKTGNTCGWSTTSGATTVSTITVPENNTGTLNLYKCRNYKNI